MKIRITLVIFLVPLILNGQANETKENVGFQNLSIGVNYSPDFCYRALRNMNKSSSSQSMIQTRKENEVPKLGNTFGFLLSYKFINHFELGSGIQFSTKGYASHIIMSSLRFPDQIDPTTGFTKPTAEPNPVTDFKILYNHQYLDIPIGLSYIIGNETIKIISSAGITTNILIKSTYRITKNFENGVVEKGNLEPYKHNFNPINLSPFISSGIDYKIANNFNLRLEPTLRFGIIGITKMPINEYLWNAGLDVSFLYKL